MSPFPADPSQPSRPEGQVELSRRRFLSIGGTVAAGMMSGASALNLGCQLSVYGPLGPPDPHGIRLPSGFSARLIARSGDPIGPRAHPWHFAPDGGATFELRDGGWIYVSNAELISGGGVSGIRFSRDGQVVDAYPVCSGTLRNCAGGATPWNTWLTCEEVGFGLVHECDPWGTEPSVARPAMGRFNHEAVAVDPSARALYLTEDARDGGFYRFLPDAWRKLGSGRLEIAEVDQEGALIWHPVPNPDPNLFAGETPTRHQVPAATPFNGGEGIVWNAARRSLFFTTKGDGRVWRYHPRSGALRVHYDPAEDPFAQLSGVDNITTTPRGQVLVAEDGGNMELVLVDDYGVASALLRIEGQRFSELAGPAFDPSGTRLYVSSQRGVDGRGLTYEISGPFA
jgi:secreted PhoX family phosphatase